MKAIDKLYQTIDQICQDNNVNQPLTVASAALLIMKHKDQETARELFTNVINESEDVFAKSAYEATLEKIIK